MNKSISTIYFLLLNYQLVAQSEPFFYNFLALKSGDSKFVVESNLNTLQSFLQSDFNMTWDKELYETDSIQYSNLKYECKKDKVDITSLFCNGKLYWKNISFSFPKDAYSAALEKFDTIKSFVINNFLYIDEENYTVSNDEYGSEIGELKVFLIDKNNKNYSDIKCTMAAELRRKNALNLKSPFVISGYKVYMSFTNLSKTPLNSNSGYMTY